MSLWRALADFLFKRATVGNSVTKNAQPAAPPVEDEVRNPGQPQEQSGRSSPSDKAQQAEWERPTWFPKEVTSAPFNFSGLGPLYREAVLNNSPTVAFKIRNGVGQFLFMMFFSEEDEQSRDQLYLFLARTSTLLRLKMYGSHRRGDFKVYMTPADEQAIREELDIHGGAHRFDMFRFLGDLNAAFPKQLGLEKTIETLRDHRDLFQKGALRVVVDEALKIYLIGPRSLPPNQRPREKTLRKLYLYVKADPGVIADLVAELKSKNKTVAWTDDPKKARNNTVQFLNSLRL